MLKINANALNIYTDGSCLPSPRRGGIGFRFVFPEFIDTDEPVLDFSPPGYRGATNNQMEILACTTALKEFLKRELSKNIKVVDIYTDSIYVSNNYKTAPHSWSKNSWMTKDGGPVLNYELWKDLLRQLKKVSSTGVAVEIHWVKGHDKNEHNKAVDHLAKKSAQTAMYELPNQEIVRRKLSHEKTEVGSVSVAGQRLKIRIISGMYIPQTRGYRYRFEVISKHSTSYKKVDFLLSSFPMREAHSYEVSFSKNRKIPTISRVISEILE